MGDAFGGDMLHIRSGDVSGFTEARRRKAREQAVKTQTLSRSGMHLPQTAPQKPEIIQEVEDVLKPQCTLKGTEMSKRGKATDALWKPTTDDPNLPPVVDIGSRLTNTHLAKPSTQALRTSDTYESSLQSRPAIIPRVDGAKPGIGLGRKIGLPEADRVVHTQGNVGGYAALPTDAYRMLAENSRKQGIGSNIQVRY
eukprot:m.143542 g.143542  ORF g.143542 m.143542 type:complete len:197 (+) comp14093_c0_seq4:5054-5644(+)